MRRYGVMSCLYERILFKLRIATQGEEQVKLSVDLSDITPVFVSLVVGIAGSLALFLVELCIVPLSLRK
jgi:hypothetical protein